MIVNEVCSVFLSVSRSLRNSGVSELGLKPWPLRFNCRALSLELMEPANWELVVFFFFEFVISPYSKNLFLLEHSG